MSLSIVVDMNLSPTWAEFLSAKGWPSLHWSQIGHPAAPDDEIMEWCKANARAVFTCDLDFSRALALVHAHGPSVIQLRGELLVPDLIGAQVEMSIRSFAGDLARGAVLTIEAGRVRIRTLPFESEP